MSNVPWLTILGLGEDGPNAMTPASLKALQSAEFVMGATRHLSLLPEVDAELITWPVPFADGIAQLLELRGKRVVALASGDPFWFGAGSVFARHLQPDEWTSIAGPATFSLAAAQMGWPLENTLCLGLHAAPLSRLRAHLSTGQKCIVLLRDGAALQELSTYISDNGFGDSDLTVLEALGGPRQRVTAFDQLAEAVQHPVCVAIDIKGSGPAISKASGKDDALFANDGQITKRPIRALTLSALAPKFGEHLWDLGTGSGSIAIEWLLSHPSVTATAVEANSERAARAAHNAMTLGVERLDVITAKSIDVLDDLPAPDVVFVGGGLTQELLDALWNIMPVGCRFVTNAVTLESEVIVAQAHAAKGGELMRIEIANSKPLGTKRGWSSAYPIVQWSVTR
ncbi:MAG: precorrin-6y C5,15-methyltransferase (decarboxylating) subunit CbiE [Ascidiaceihabitans sp.]|jgi:precorrin-6Y C5,15-methyltransferase (decarboxylating)|nr:precorrin-6y C5,15-methyltransferase (decarboxylating) subunit CbiE [Ascidiaceihabitans sp.]